MTDDYHNIIQDQFGPVARNYITSAVHSQGEDLNRIATVAACRAPKHALDLGCGGGHVSFAIASHASRVTACDLSSEMLAAVEGEGVKQGISNLSVQRSAAESLPFKDAEFDFLACRFSVHHWQDAAAGLAEARRVLRPGASAIFVDGIAPPLAAADTHLQAVELLRDPSHGRDYSEREWRIMLEEAGFTVTAITKSRLRMEFASWTARMRTDAEAAQAIRRIQELASGDVSRHFAIEADGSFMLDTILIEAQ